MQFRRARLLLGAGFLVLVLIVSVPNAAALNETMDVIVVPSTTTVSWGASVTLTIHVFNFGAHADASTLTVDTASRTLTTTPMGTGVYETTFTVQDADRYSNSQNVAVYVTATIGTLTDSGYAFLNLGPWFAVEVTTPVSRVNPGDTVDVTARTTVNGTLTDADSVSVRASAVVPGLAENSQDLTLTRTGTGTYVGSYLAPPSITQEGLIYFDASANLAPLYDYDFTRIGVGSPGPFTVWFRPVNVGASSGTIDVFVANATGWPVAGAALAGSYAYYTTSEQSGTFSGMTNASGAARVTLSYPGAAYGGPEFHGTFTAGSLTGGFAGYLNTPATEIVVLTEPETWIYAPGSAVSVRSHLYLDGQPVAGETVYYYAYSRSAVIGSGTTATDANGQVTVSFLMPSEDVSIHYAVDNAGTWYNGYEFVSSHPLTVTHNTVHAGSLLQVSVPSFPVTPDTVYITFQGMESTHSYQSAWSLASGSTWTGDFVYPTGGSVQFGLQLPRFLPKGQDYKLFVSSYPQDPTQPFYRYEGLIHIDNVPPTSDATASATTVTVGDSVTVDASSSADADGTVVAYRYVWGDGNTTDWNAVSTAAHTYERAGSYTVTVSVRDDNGAEQSTTLTIRVESAAAPPGPAGMSDLLLPIGLALVVAAVAGVAFFLWRRSRRPPAVSAPPPMPPAVPAAPEVPPSVPAPGPPPTPP